MRYWLIYWLLDYMMDMDLLIVININYKIIILLYLIKDKGVELEI